MADKDLELNIKTVADLTGVRKAADAIAILNEQARKSQAEAGAGKDGGAGGAGIAEHVGRGLERVALHALGVGAIFEAINQVKQLAEEYNKISEALDKEGEQLVKNAQSYAQEAKAATTEADVLKISERALKDVEAAHGRVRAAASAELTIYQKITDEIYHQVVVYATHGQAAAKAGRLEQQALDQRLTGETQLAAVAEQNAINATQLAETFKEIFDEEKLKPFNTAIADTVQHIKDLEAVRANQAQGTSEWVQSTQDILVYEGHLKELIKLHEALVTSVMGIAKAQAQTFFQGPATFLQQQAKAGAEHEAERASLRQQLGEADAMGDTARAQAIRDQLSNDRFARGQRKEELQRYVALQESIGAGVGDAADQLKAIGPEGVRRYEAAKSELQEIYRQQRDEKQQMVGGISSDAAAIIEAIKAGPTNWQ